MPDNEAFSVLANFINNFEVIRNFMLGNIPAIQSNFKVIEYYLQKMAPELLDSLREFGAYVDGIIMENVCCVFARCAPAEYVR